MNERNPLLIAGGCCSLIIALLHVVIVAGGPSWYRYFGAGEEMALMAEEGSWYPALLTLGIAALFAIWAAYAFSGAGFVKKLPLLKPGLIIIAVIYILRGLAAVPTVITADDNYSQELADKPYFMIVTSVISLTIGIFYALGIRKMNAN